MRFDTCCRQIEDRKIQKVNAVGVPAWLSFNRSTGLLSGTPPIGSAGTYGGIVILVSDGQASALLPAFSITVQTASNGAPSISGTPSAAANVGQAYSFTPTASDPDGQVLAFGIANRPAWASFDVTTGELSGTPADAHVGTYSNIVISVSDGTAAATLPAFTIEVSASGNTAPKISGAPSAVATVGQAYAFTPTASDPDGQVLAFGIANQPGWTNFDVTTGRLSGTPVDADVGTYSNIVISVSDGTASATLPAFSIAVQRPVIGTADLSWTAPTLNDDGSPLGNLAGYKVRYGTSPGALTNAITVPNPSTLSASIEGLAGGIWYFTVASYTNTGVESNPAGPVSTLIQ